MGRTKKNLVEVEQIEEEPIEIDSQTPVVQEHHQVTRRWKLQKPLEEMENEQTEFEESAVSTDPVQAVLDEMSGSTMHTWSIAVLRLKNYARDGRNDPRAGSHCGVLSVLDAAYIGENKYIEDIQARWAKGGETNFFLPIVRRDNRMHKYLPVIAVEPPDPLMIARQQAENPAGPIHYYVQPQTAPQDGFKQFLSQAKQFAELRDLLLPPDYVPSQQAPQINTTEQALLHLANADGSVIETVTDRIGKLLRRTNDGGHEVTVMDLLLEAIKSDLPARLFKEARNLIVEIKSGVPADGSPALPSLGSPESAPSLPQTNASPAEAQVIPTRTPPEVMLLNFVINACAQHKIWSPDTSAQWIIEFEEHNPSVTPYIAAFLSMSPDAALAWLSQAVPQAGQIAQMPHAKQWITELQEQLKPEETSDKKTT